MYSMADAGNTDHSDRRKRLRSKYAKLGASALSDRELIELALFDVIARSDTGSLADALLEKFASPLGVFTAEKHELAAVHGIGCAAAKHLHSIGVRSSETLAADALSSSLPPDEKLTAFCKYKLITMPLDTMLVICFDRKGNIADHTVLYPCVARSESDIASEAVSLCAAAKTKSVALAHTHAQNGISPSDEDIASTAVLYRILKKQGIVLGAHIITSMLDAADILPSCVDLTTR